MAEKAHAPARAPNVPLAQFARRRRCHRDTITRNAYLMAHASRGIHGAEWPESFVAAECERQPEPVDPDLYPHNRRDVARLTGWSIRWLEQHTAGQTAYSDADVRRLIVKRGAISEAAVLHFLQARNRQQIAFLVGKGQLRKPSTLGPDDSWLWHEPAAVLDRIDLLLGWLNHPNVDGHSFALDYQDAAEWLEEAVPGLEELQAWELAEADRMAATATLAAVQRMTKDEVRTCQEACWRINKGERRPGDGELANKMAIWRDTPAGRRELRR